MARASRRIVSEEDDDDLHDKSIDQSNGDRDQDDEEDSLSFSRRKKRRVNYNEDNFISELDDEELDDPDAEITVKKDDSQENNDDEEYGSQRSRSRNGKKRRDEDDDDEYVSDNYEDDDPSLDEDEELNSDSSFTYRQRRKNNMSGFIVKDEDDNDDDDDDEDGRAAKRKLKRKQNSRSRRSRSFGRRKASSRRRRNVVKDDDDDDEDDEVNEDSDDITKDSVATDNEAKDELTLEQELQDLKDSSPMNSPVTRNLRERKQINYTLPPPITNDNQLDADDMDAPSTPHRRNGTGMGRGRYNNIYGGPVSGLGSGLSSFNQPIRRLFPTVGPFGGGDVVSVFHKGITDTTNLTALGNADDSSDSDDEELFKPTDPNDTSSKIITAASMDPSNPLHKKKNTLADTDPLGIDTNIDFSAVGGLDNYINQLKEMITLPLLYPEIYSQFHITPPRGVLFHGPPGTGKTLMARALAASCSSEGQKITFFMRKGADCLSKWVGEAERHLRLLFEEAKQQQPAIIFFDEIDGLAPVRSSKQEQIHASIVSTLLALMDGMDNRGQVIVIGATNRPDSIDPALRRPGRFDREFYFPLPDKKARKEILEIQMRKWKNKPSEDFIQELARLTKGYGGADLRALCTESALNSIQRSFPQIYRSNDKLKIDLNKIEVQASDFMRAVAKIIPSSARATSTQSSPLPETIQPLLNRNLELIIEQLDKLVPNEKPPTILEESDYLDVNAIIHPEDGGFKHYQLLSRLGSTRCYRPRLIISGLKGSGQNYISKAVLHHLESFHIQVLDFSKIYNETAVSPESCLIQIFSELKRHKPSVLYIPDALNFITNVTPSFRSTMYGLVKSIDANDRILLMAMIEDSKAFEEDSTTKQDILEILDMDNENDIFELKKVNDQERKKFFKNVWEAIALNPYEFGDLSVRPKRKLKKLKVVKPASAIVANGNNVQSSKEKAKKEKELLKQDMSLKNTLKIRLSALMDLFKVRYKRFKKPTIDDAYLVHLFEAFPNPEAVYQRDPQDDLILDTSTGKKFYNIDLEVIEERLWNGFYSEPQQFLKDIEMILKDAKTVGDRERILKANEMYANAQVGIEEIELAFPGLVEQWKDLRKREKQKEKEYMEKLALEKSKEPVVHEIQDLEAVPDAVASTSSIANTENMIDMQDSEDKADVKMADAAFETDVVNNGQEQAQAQLQVGNTAALAKDTMLPVEPIFMGNGSVNHKEDEMETEETKASEGADDETKEETNQNEEKEKEKEKEKEEEGEEEEEEEEVVLPEIPEVVIDKSTLKGLKKKLVEVTENKTIDELERIDSKLIETIWSHRLSVDKSKLLKELDAYISSI